MGNLMKNRIHLFFIPLLAILLCGCQESQNNTEEKNQEETISGTDSLHQVRYVTRYENLVEREPHLKTYPPTPREIHCQLIEMTDRIDMYDTEFYDSVYLARQNDTLERYLYYDMLSVSMLMANKRHYPKAYYDTYIILKELFKLDSMETVNDDIVDLCMFYLIRSAQLGYRPACKLTGIYNKTAKFNHKELFEKLHKK